MWNYYQKDPSTFGEEEFQTPTVIVIPNHRCQLLVAPAAAPIAAAAAASQRAPPPPEGRAARPTGATTAAMRGGRRRRRWKRGFRRCWRVCSNVLSSHIRLIKNLNGDMTFWREGVYGRKIRSNFFKVHYFQSTHHFLLIFVLTFLLFEWLLSETLWWEIWLVGSGRHWIGGERGGKGAL